MSTISTPEEELEALEIRIQAQLAPYQKGPLATPGAAIPSGIAGECDARDNAGSGRNLVRGSGLREVAFQLPPSEPCGSVLDLALASASEPRSTLGPRWSSWPR